MVRVYSVRKQKAERNWNYARQLENVLDLMDSHRFKTEYYSEFARSRRGGWGKIYDISRDSNKLQQGNRLILCRTYFTSVIPSGRFRSHICFWRSLITLFMKLTLAISNRLLLLIAISNSITYRRLLLINWICISQTNEWILQVNVNTCNYTRGKNVTL